MTDPRQRIERTLHAIWYGESALKWLLYPLGLVFQWAAGLRRRLYALGVFRVISLPLPVIVIGNLTVGGTGKTPVTIWLATRLVERGYRVGIVCRGYGGKAGAWPQAVSADSDPRLVGDEAVLLATRSGCPVVAAPDRVAAARALCERDGVDVILSDDGMQHFRLGRTLEIAVVDGVRGLGNGLGLPAGPLREPASRLGEADAVVVNGGTWGHPGVLRTSMESRYVYELASGREQRLDDFRGRRAHAVAAIGHPERFFALLERHGLAIMPHALADHADVGAEDIRFDDGEPVFVTEKDAVKCRSVAGPGVWCVVVEPEFDAQDGERLLQLVTRHLDAEAD